MQEIVDLMWKTIRSFKTTRMILQADAIGGTIIAYDKENKKNILSLAKHLGVDNIKVVTKDEYPNGISPSLIIIDDHE